MEHGVKPRRVLFLDIDGVLNDHNYDAACQSSRILPRCVVELNVILEAVDCHLVISSAWRYMILNGEMTERGFEYMLRTHGVRCVDRVVGTTCKDSQLEDANERSSQILGYVNSHEVRQYVALDDLDLRGINLVRTKGDVGLTPEDANRAIAMFK